MAACRIVNHSPSFSPSGGSHWMACRVKGTTAFWFNSYGLSPHAQLEFTNLRGPSDTLWLKRMGVESVEYNDHDLQSVASEVCGLYACYFAVHGLPQLKNPTPWNFLSDPRRQPQRRHHQEESHCLTNKTSLMFFVKPSVPTIQPVRSTPVGVIHRLDHRDDPGRAGARHVSGHNQHGDLQHPAREMVYPCMLHKVVGFQGVFSSNTVSVTVPWQPKDACWIVNHSPSFSPSGRGSHWVACRVQGNKAFWFDSYGLPPHAQLENKLMGSTADPHPHFDRWLKRMGVETWCTTTETCNR
jgi:hypothetical protein